MSRRYHQLLRFIALVALAGSTVYMAQRSNVRADATAEGLSEITPDTRALIASVAKDKPVVATAYLSKEVPRHFVALRSRLLNILREMEAESSGTGLTVRIFEPEPHSEQGQEAVEKHGIAPRSVMNSEGGRVDAMPVFLGVAFTSGPREEVIPFFDRGLSVEYEIARALRVVVQEKKRVVGVFGSDIHLMGNFDLQSRRQDPPWRIVEELRKQYEVRNLNATSPIPDDVDVLFVPQISSLPQAGLDNVRKYVDAGKPALIVADPMPVFNIKLSPTQPMLPPPGDGGMMGGGQPAQEKGDYRGLLAGMGVNWSDTHIVYDTENPNPRMEGAPRHVIFVGEREGKSTFEGGDPIVDGLAQVVTLFSGSLEQTDGSDVEFTPLLTTGSAAGFDTFETMVDDSNFLLGLQGPVIPRRRGPAADEPLVIGARLRGAAASGEDKKPINAIVLGDLDMFADSFFAFHEQGGDVDGDGLIDIRFDNVTFLLNCIDTLAADDRFVELRKRQPAYRRLEKVDEFTREAREKREEEISAADAEAEKQQQEAQAELDKAVEAIRSRADLDETTKRIMMRSAEEAENRRLVVRKQQIEREKAQRVDKIDVEFMRAVDAVQNRIRLFAILLPPVPALLMGLLLFARKRRREAAMIPENRKRAKGGKS